MGNKAVIIRLLLLTIVLGQMSQCTPPFNPDFESGIGTLIYKGVCQNQRVYLVNLYFLNANRTGFNASDTLTIGKVTFNRVVRLGTTRASFLDQKTVGDKIAFDFTSTRRTSLPICSGLRQGSFEYIKLLSIGNSQF
jgi:hypothetical protein